MQLSLLNLLFPQRKQAPKKNPKRRAIPIGRPRAPSQRGSAPELMAIWTDLRTTYFPDRADIDSYLVVWSRRRQKRTLASCNMRRHKVNVAKELRHPDYTQWLYPLLYHEMCHAILGDSCKREGQRAAWHGREFRLLEQRHPDMIAFNAWVRSGGWLTAIRRERARSRYEIKAS